MMAESKSSGELYQEVAVSEISSRFGEGFVCQNAAGNQAIRRVVLGEFNKLTGDKVVWERGRRLWRFREAGDEPGRMQP
jgi:hypothetical protein